MLYGTAVQALHHTHGFVWVAVKERRFSYYNPKTIYHIHISWKLQLNSLTATELFGNCQRGCCRHRDFVVSMSTRFLRRASYQRFCIDSPDTKSFYQRRDPSSWFKGAIRGVLQKSSSFVGSLCLCGRLASSCVWKPCANSYACDIRILLTLYLKQYLVIAACCRGPDSYHHEGTMFLLWLWPRIHRIDLNMISVIL